MTPLRRLLLAIVLFDGWIFLLLMGWAPAPLVHLLLAGALAAFPWRLLRADDEPRAPGAASSDDEPR